MLAPSIFGMNDLFDDFGDVFEFSPAFRKQVAAARNISSDIKELADGYQIEMELPGFSKEEVKAQLKDGYLTITAMQKIKKRTTKKVRRRKPLNISVVKDIMASAREVSLLART